MNKRDYDELSDEQLGLFPLTEFWDSKKGKWAAGDAGRFGKQNSEKLKLIFGAEKFNA